jgi:hypothetical protein
MSPFVHAEDPTMPTFPAPQPHGPITELFPDVYVVHGSFRMNALVTIARNMIVLREEKELTLVNAVRLSEEGERALEALGTVRHLVKLGPGHTLDDPYMRHRYRPRFWSGVRRDGDTEELVEGAAGPSARAAVFRFQRAKAGEAALIWKQEGGDLLVTCDSVQNWVDTAGCSFVGGLVTRVMGFIEPAKIGPFWLKAVTGGRPAEMKPDFDRLLGHDFKHLIAGHGVVLRDDAHAALARSVARQLV